MAALARMVGHPAAGECGRGSPRPGPGAGPGPEHCVVDMDAMDVLDMADFGDLLLEDLGESGRAKRKQNKFLNF